MKPGKIEYDLFIHSKREQKKPQIHTNLSRESHEILDIYCSEKLMGKKRWKNTVIDLALKIFDDTLKEAAKDPRWIGYYLAETERSAILARKLLRDKEL